MTLQVPHCLFDLPSLLEMQEADGEIGQRGQSLSTFTAAAGIFAKDRTDVTSVKQP